MRPDGRPLPEILGVDHEPSEEELTAWLVEHCDRGTEVVVDRNVVGGGDSVIYSHAGAMFWEDSVERAVRHIAERWVRYGSRRYGVE